MASEGDKYITSGAWLRCDKGATPGKLTATPKTVKLYGQDWATQLEAVPLLNIPSFGACLVTHAPCAPLTVLWLNVMETVEVQGQKPLLDISTCQCTVGGLIKIYFTQQAALAAGEAQADAEADADAEQEAKEDAEFWGDVGKGLLIAAAVVGTVAVIAATGGGALVVLGAAAATGAAVGGVGGAVAGGITGGAEGAISGFFQGAAYGALGGLAVASGAGVAAAALGGLAAGAGIASLGFLGKAYYHNPSRENGLVLVGAGAGILASLGTAKVLAPRTALVSRAEDRSYKRVNVDENGNVNITGDKTLHVAIDNKTHSVYFYKLRGGANKNFEIVSFRIPRKLANQIKKASVAQKDGRKFPDAPQIDDPHISPNLYGLKKNWIDKLNEQAIKGSGKVSQPKNPVITNPKLNEYYENKRKDK